MAPTGAGDVDGLLVFLPPPATAGALVPLFPFWPPPPATVGALDLLFAIWPPPPATLGAVVVRTGAFMGLLVPPIWPPPPPPPPPALPPPPGCAWTAAANMAAEKRRKLSFIAVDSLSEGLCGLVNFCSRFGRIMRWRCAAPPLPTEASGPSSWGAVRGRKPPLPKIFDSERHPHSDASVPCSPYYLAEGCRGTRGGIKKNRRHPRAKYSESTESGIIE
jgi:hypothetical protein